MKSTIRKNILQKRNLLDDLFIDEASINITKKILNTKQFLICENLFIFMSMSKEINTRFLIDTAFNYNKKVCVPVVTDKHTMQFSVINKYSEFERKPFGTFEPKVKNFINSDDKTLIIVPGLCYSKLGYRIGYGGGYYDKYLKNNVFLASFGVCLKQFVSNTIPLENWDEKVDYLFSQD